MAIHFTCDVCKREIERSEMQLIIHGSYKNVLWKFELEREGEPISDVCENCMGDIKRTIDKEMDRLDTSPRAIHG